MKDKYWHIDAMDYLLFALSILGILLVILSHRAKNDVDNLITTTDTIVINDTITEWKPYDVYHYRTDTAYLPKVDTINDTIVKLDSVYVEVPIYTYRYDTVIQDTSYKTHLKAVVSGFRCQMDSLYLSTEIMRQEAKKQPWYNRFAPSCGIGIGTDGKIGVFVGVGYKLF
jgi:hypothetical protein